MPGTDTHSDFRKLSDFRAFMEGYAARCATMRIAENPTFVDSLREILKRLTKAARQRNFTALNEADEQFHRTIMDAAGVPGLAEAWTVIWKKLDAHRQSDFNGDNYDWRALTDGHEYLVEAIALCDPAVAEDAARSHIEAVWVRLETMAHGKGDKHNPLYLASAYLASHMQYPLRLDKVAAKVASISPRHLSRLFQQQHGMGFQAYLQHLRMTKAAELLAKSSLPIAAIARRTGYRCMSLFIAHFVRHHHLCPREWRKMKNSRPRPAQRTKR